MEFKDKVAVLTGGGSGIGKATATALAAQGARVAICGRSMDKLERVARQDTPGNGEILPIRADISERSDMQRLYEEVDRPADRSRWPICCCFSPAGRDCCSKRQRPRPTGDQFCSNSGSPRTRFSNVPAGSGRAGCST